MTKDEALKLASALDHWATQTDMGRKPDPRSLPRKASAELRRLHREIERIKAAQPAQNPASVTCKEVADAMNELRKGTFEQRQVADEMENKRLYTTPPAAAKEENT